MYYLKFVNKLEECYFRFLGNWESVLFQILLKLAIIWRINRLKFEIVGESIIYLFADSWRMYQLNFGEFFVNSD